MWRHGGRHEELRHGEVPTCHRAIPNNGGSRRAANRTPLVEAPARREVRFVVSAVRSRVSSVAPSMERYLIFVGTALGYFISINGDSLGLRHDEGSAYF